MTDAEKLAAAIGNCRACGKKGRIQPFRWRTDSGALVYALFCFDCHQKATAKQNDDLRAVGRGGRFTSQWRGRRPAQQCDLCSRTKRHTHCPECGSVDHVAADCDMEG